MSLLAHKRQSFLSLTNANLVCRTGTSDFLFNFWLRRKPENAGQLIYLWTDRVYGSGEQAFMIFFWKATGSFTIEVLSKDPPTDKIDNVGNDTRNYADGAWHNLQFLRVGSNFTLVVDDEVIATYDWGHVVDFPSPQQSFGGYPWTFANDFSRNSFPVIDVAEMSIYLNRNKTLTTLCSVDAQGGVVGATPANCSVASGARRQLCRGTTPCCSRCVASFRRCVTAR